MRIISYYTKGSGYKKEAKKLIESLNKFRLQYDIQEVKSLGNWQMNTQFKAVFIRNLLDKHNEPLVWLDADAIVMQYPGLFDKMSGFDLAVYYSPRNNRHIRSGTIYMANNDKVKRLVDRWIEINQEHVDWWDQKSLTEAVSGWDGDVFELPEQYCYVFDHRKIDNPVIVHYQKSRVYKI